MEKWPMSNGEVNSMFFEIINKDPELSQLIVTPEEEYEHLIHAGYSSEDIEVLFGLSIDDDGNVTSV